jgi:hypothetical protein
MGTIFVVRRRSEPEEGVLCRVVQAEWATFVRCAEAGERVVPRFCVREVQNLPANVTNGWGAGRTTIRS